MPKRKNLGTSASDPNSLGRTLPRRNGIRPWTKKYWELMSERVKDYTPDIVDKYQTDLNPRMLKALAILYFEEAHNDTIIKRDYIRSGERAGEIVEIKVQRPFSHTGLELFIEAHGIRSTILDIRKNKDGRFSEFADVVQWIDAVIAQDKYDGAAVGNYNANLISRDLGLAEKVDASVKTEQPLFSDLPAHPQAQQNEEPEP